MRYAAYQLTIESELELPELPPAPAGDREPDVRILLGGADREALGEAKQAGPFLWTRPGGLLLEIPGIARFLVADGNTIRVSPAPGIDEDGVRLFLLGSALGALLQQRGLLVLHGNAIRVGDACMVCVGRSGAGKSSLAAAFLRRGFPVLADDVVAVDAQGRALPGVPRLKLWRDMAARLGHDVASLRRIRPELPKFHVPLPDPPPGGPLPVRWVYVLQAGAQGRPGLEPVAGMERFTQFQRHSYRFRFLDGMGLRPGHLRELASLSGRVRMARVRRPADVDSLDLLVDTLSADLAAHP